MTDTVTHFVRDKEGKVLDRLELELELPKFINEELVELLGSLPYVNDYQTTLVDSVPS